MSHSRILVVQLGAKNAGPNLAISLAESLNKCGLLSGLALSTGCDIEKGSLEKFKKQVYTLKTYHSIASFFCRILRLNSLRKDFATILDSTKPDLVMLPMQHILDFVLFYEINKNQARKKIPVISWVHDVDPHPGDSKLITRFLMSNTLRNSNVLVVLSSLVRERLLRQTTSSIVQIVHPIEKKSNILSRRPSPKKGAGKVLFSGRLVKYKGIERMSRAWDIVIQECPDWELVVAGVGDDILVQKEFRLKQNVDLINRYLTKAEMQELFFDSDIIAIPYDESSQSGVLADAVAFGKPYLITPIEGLLEQFQSLGGGIVAEDMSPESFARGIIDLIRKESEISPSRREEFSWDSQTSNLMSQIEKLKLDEKRRVV